ncbi:lambda exonuclease family protein [Candidatus Venteria ishoeyi]|uniref:YqaJ-like viral recombinase domain protein n=1 Tax=Candidatus Venteria ishoeyi TaxID=1899563 RepID=A0A1H6F8P9_9GAMM|nr:lambda exonuclease family protein [Candidatus Venteria ishoeyi]SEH06492.1 YqaJ-like viral recombinase domain protein [Candidatus Venteria ishoeyi]
MTIILEELEQGTDEWLNARLGIPTASCFKNIFTKSMKPTALTGDTASAGKSYLYNLLSQFVSGEPDEPINTKWIERGKALEPEAVAFYEFVNDVQVDRVGIGYLDESRNIAASPDGLMVGGGLEIKCPKLSTHLQYVCEARLPPEYVQQVQGNIWIFDVQWWDFMSYHPESKRQLIIRIKRDDGYIKKLADAVLAFSEKLEQLKKEMA